MGLLGRNALVTGAESGIGQSIASAFALAIANAAIHYGTDHHGAENTAAQARQHA